MILNRLALGQPLPRRLNRLARGLQVLAALLLLAIHLSQGAIGDHHEIVVHFRHDQKAPALVATRL